MSPIPYQFRDFYGYDKDAVSVTAPTGVTINSSSINWNNFSADGAVSGNGGATITARGFVYSTSNSTPVIGGSGVTQVADGTGTGSFSETLPPAGNFTNCQTVYFRAYATNSAGTTYSNVDTATTTRRPHTFKYATGKFGHSLVCNSTDTVTVYAQSDLSTNLVLQLQEPIYSNITCNDSNQPSGLISYSDGNHKGRWTGSAWQSGFTESC